MLHFQNLKVERDNFPRLAFQSGVIVDGITVPKRTRSLSVASEPSKYQQHRTYWILFSKVILVVSLSSISATADIVMAINVMILLGNWG